MRRHVKKPAPFLILTSLFLLCSLHATAGETPNRATGFHPEGVYDFLGLDVVNAFNGNLTITVPLGITYPVAEKLSYRFNLVHNANGWEYVQDRRTMWNTSTDSCEDPIGATLDQCKQRNYAYTKPTKLSNAGIGWSVSLGRLVGLPSGNLAYESPAGARHELFTQLGSIETDFDSTITYTVDGSYLRSKRLPDGTYKIEFPDGAVHTFVPAQGSLANLAYELTRMEDRWGNWATISRNLVNPYYPYNSAWLIQDIHGRQQRIYFKPEPHYYGEVIDRIHLEGFGGAPGGDSEQGAEPADGVYQFLYQDITLARHCIVEGPDYDTQAIWDPLVSKYMQVPVLTGVTLPDGTAFTINASDYNVGTTDQCPTATSGTLKKLTLPTGGRIEWDWQMREFPNESGDNVHFTLSDYVTTRRLVDANGLTRGTTQYSSTGTSQNDWITTIVRPGGSSEKQYFSLHSPFEGGIANMAEYGLPFSRVARPENKYTGSNLFISRVLLAAGQSDAAQAEQLDFVLYEGHGAVENGYRKITPDAPRQVVRSRSDYRQSDGSTYVHRGQTSSEFDGYGHYRTSVTDGSFESGNVRQTTRRWNAGRGVFGSPLFQPRLASEPWLLQTWDLEESIEGSSSIRSEFAFDTNGALSAKRNYAGASRGANDVIVKLQRDSFGQVVGERHYGGDGMALDTVYSITHPSFPYPVCAAYRLSNTWSYGVLATSNWYTRTANTACENAAPLPFYSLNRGGIDPLTDMARGIDRSTGLISIESDTALVETSFTYDRMGRLTTSVSPSGATTTYNYYRVGTEAHIGISTVSSLGAALLSSDIRFDAFGRLVERKTLRPDGTSPSRLTVYDDKGRITKQYEEQLVPTHFTEFWNFDAFDRPGLITAPDGTTTTLSYSGTSRTSRTRSYESIGGAALATVQEEYDAAGRLFRLTDADGTLTQYSYDVGDRLTEVAMDVSGATQYRSFTYDGRGFLSSETHPETGLIVHGSYDARGNAGSRTFPNAPWPNVMVPPPDYNYNTFDLLYSYDGAGKLTEVRSRNPNDPANFRALKQFIFGTGAVAGDRSLGKLTEAIRFNYGPTSGTARVSEKYAYEDAAGRLTTKKTEVKLDFTVVQEFQQSFSYTELGKPHTFIYPTCVLQGAECGTSSSPSTLLESVSHTYARGLLKSVSGKAGIVSFGLADDITYHGNGMMKSILHGNGVVVDQLADPHGMARPSEIRFSNALACSPPVITQQPQSKSVPAGMTTRITVTASGTGALSYQWYQGPLGDRTIPLGTNVPYLDVAPTQPTSYWVRITNTCGSTSGSVASMYSSSEGPVSGSSTTTTGSVFSNPATITQSLPNGATFVSQNVPSTMAPGQTYTVSVTMRNSGSSTWTAAEDYKLGSANPLDNLTWATRRVLLPAGTSIAPNTDRTFTFNVTAPVAPGTYNFQWKMVREFIEWFGASSTNVAINVRTIAPADFNGDGRSDVVLFRDGAWLFWDYSTKASLPGVWTGQPNPDCIPAPADYDGDGDWDFSLLCGEVWHFYHANGSYWKGIATGGTGYDLPAPGDYNGDGFDEAVLYRNGTWRAYDFASGALAWSVYTGPASGGKPLATDYDGDGTSDLSVFAAGSWHFYNDDGTYLKGIWTGGVAGDVPAPGDYNGDGRDEVVVFRGGAWLFWDFATGASLPGVWTGATSSNGDPLQPAPSDFDGDGRLDFSILAGGPWAFYDSSGAYLKGIWTGGVVGDQSISRRQQ